MRAKDPCLINCELFGKRASFFDSAIVPLWKGVYDSLARRAEVKQGSTALDVGTGSGEVALRLAEDVGKRGRVVAIDAQSEMLKIAGRKARSRGLRNVEFELMSMERIDLPENSFDSVVANYSLCCCADYRAALSECYEVLKPGGKLTYNHGGPSDPLATQVLFSIFERYKTTAPSKRLSEIRVSNAAQTDGFKRYRDPFVVLDLLRTLGFRGAEAALTRHKLKYDSCSGFVNEWLLFDWYPETKELSRRDLDDFRKEAIEALGHLSRGRGFDLDRDVVYFMATKP